MLNLVEITDQKAVTTSRIIADAFDKRHDTVLRAIRDLECPGDFVARNFAGISYTDDNNRQKPAYEITRDGFMLVAMGFTGKKAVEFKIKFIEAFNAMEKALLDGQGEIKRVDFEHNRSRRMENPHGIDIKYNLDLTKIIMNPTAEGVQLLSHLTGIDMDDVIADLSQKSTSASQQVDRFILECCNTSNPNEGTVGKDIYIAFDAWRERIGLPLLGKKTFFQALLAKFTRHRKSHGMVYMGLQLVGEGSCVHIANVN